MSYELTKYRTFTQHDAACSDCSKLKHPTSIHLPVLEEELRKNISKRNITDRKIKDISFTVRDLERMLRDATRQGRDDFKYQLTYRLSMKAGYLHMLLRYALLLKQDNKRLHYLLSQAEADQTGPLPTLNFMDALELDMASSAPDVGALLMYDFYNPTSVVEEEEEIVEAESVEEEGEEEPTEYSIMNELFAALGQD